MTTYRYWPLGPEPRMIRLVTIHPGVFEDDIGISLHHVQLDTYSLPSGEHDGGPSNASGACSTAHSAKLTGQPGDSAVCVDVGNSEFASTPDHKTASVRANITTYECLSYAWGSEEDPLNVHVNSPPASGTGHIIRVTQNLEQALRHLRSTSLDRVFFIDALCIDQSNIPERGEQVALMGEIYQRATRLGVNGVSFGRLRLAIEGLGFKDARDVLYGLMSVVHAIDQLQIEPDYSKPAAEVYRDAVVKAVAQTGDLRIMEQCELASLSLPGLPTWVPDFSRPQLANTSFHIQWSACAWISAQTEVLDADTLRVAAVRACVVKTVGPHDKRDQELLIALQETMKGHSVESEYPPGGTVIDAVASLLGPYSDHDENSPDFVPSSEVARRGLRCIARSRPGELSDHEQYVDFNSACALIVYSDRDAARTLLNYSKPLLTGRRFFWTEDGLVGFGPAAAQAGDVVCVILGARTPFLLRPAANRKDKWLVAGPVLVAGLMCGEAIMGSWGPHWQAYQGRSQNPKDVVPVGMRNSRDGTIVTSPTEILRMRGIQAEHTGSRVVVDHEELRAKGVNVEHFDLV
ncbi:heterokaryon incompatibility protein-domain-containing protein [Microdochium bolleyi]|uniref:Heterokaryon incompatibility protein-domain-containing protein n=1 Tax=Microdochium bolleyi TaxID=196109 RepID=A0A136IU60_9PEZI|nr:heterokaryon incompatibility protein-domain-containing protein [Microdochium bolleyi]